MAVKNISILTGANYSTVEFLLYGLDDIDLLFINVKNSSGDYKSYSFVGEYEIECVGYELLCKRVDRCEIRKQDGEYIAEVWCY